MRIFKGAGVWGVQVTPTCTYMMMLWSVLLCTVPTFCSVKQVKQARTAVLQREGPPIDLLMETRDQRTAGDQRSMEPEDHGSAGYTTSKRLGGTRATPGQS